MEPSLGDRAADALGTLLNRQTRIGLYRSITDGLSDLGVTPATYTVISGVARYGPISAAGLAPLAGVERSVASRYAARLVEGGLVARASDPADGRSTLLSLTDDGARVTALMRHRLGEELTRRMADWPDGLADAFVAGFERFVGDC
ncbi:MarR family winged helix-turn-helix transcriptional regulator [Williamsia phyllosphaerae]|uniref:HTH marR-type domain-containing protein n=1 Tax=Williamsia phyllosphaerae TaxID=885042 RepID=A0ABQ1UW17_9NOCA|nr:MarR family transcriptional regulator [Williamsia phyllosphaerae]GGF28515.1 hypothetical protein GCM10007298_25370 [Williamsia phyllosphaerae]